MNGSSYVSVTSNPTRYLNTRSDGAAEGCFQLVTKNEPNQKLGLLKFPPSCDMRALVFPVFITGSTKSGKSHLMNRMMDREEGQGGFKVGQTIQHCTEGVWACFDRLSTRSLDGAEVRVLFLDSETMNSNCCRFGLSQRVCSKT